MKTGILGGTFDPIHLGHLIMAEEAYEAAGLDRVILMPTGHSYFKENRKVAPPEVRLALCRAAAADNPHLVVSDLETRRSGDTYTVTTLRELTDLYPEDQFFYIVGADTLVQMRLWVEPAEIFRRAVILVAAREDETASDTLTDEIRELKAQYQADIRPLPVRNIEISSTDVRERVQAGRSIRYLVPPAVEEEINRRGLYQ